MKNKIQNSIKFLKRFFEPAINIKKESFQILLEGTITVIWIDLIPLFSIPYILRLLQNSDEKKLVVVIICLLTVNLIIWFFAYRIKKYFTVYSFVATKFLEKKYRPQILIKSFKHAEVIGTGKSQSVIDKGMNEWSKGNFEFIQRIPAFFGVMISAVILLYPLGLLYAMAFFVTVIMSVLGYTHFRLKQLVYKRQYKELVNENAKNSVKSIMSRQEVVYAEKVNFETEKIVAMVEKMRKPVVKESYMDFLSDLSVNSVPLIFMSGVLLFIIYTSDNLMYDLPVLVTFVYFCSRLTFFIGNTTMMMRHVIDKYPDIKIFWEYLDGVPTIEGYEEGEGFQHKGGEIELRNISFSYEK